MQFSNNDHVLLIRFVETLQIRKRLNMVCIQLWGLVLGCLLFGLFSVSAEAQAKTNTGFFYPIGSSTWGPTCGTWLGRDHNDGGCYFDGDYHIGVDMPIAETSNVYSISDGVVVQIWTTNANDDYFIGTGNSVIFVKHTLSNGSQFLAEYMHVRPTRNMGDHVTGGQIIAKIGPWYYGSHLHFGIHPNLTPPTNHWGIMPNSSWPDTNGFVDPVNWIQTQTPPGGSIQPGLLQGGSFDNRIVDCFNLLGSSWVGQPANYVHSYNVGRIQDFNGGNSLVGAILHKDNDNNAGTAFYIQAEFWDAYLNRFGGVGGFLGWPSSNRSSDANPYGVWQAFENGGRIYSRGVSNGQDVHEVHGAILGDYLYRGGSDGVLGYPISDESDAARSPKGTQGRLNRFQFGTIYFSNATGAHPVFGNINTLFEANRGTDGPYGFPTSEPYNGPYGLQQDFEGGTLYETNQPPNTPDPITADGTNYGSHSINLSWSVPTDPVPGPSEITYRLMVHNSDSSWTFDSGQILQTSANVIVPSDGVYYWRVYAKDGVDSSPPSAERVVKSDTTPPVAAFTSVHDGDSVFGFFHCSGTVSDPGPAASGVAQPRFFVDGIDYGDCATDYATFFDHALPAQNLSPGTHLVSVNVKDNNGNSAWYSIHLVTGTAAPVLTATAGSGLVALSWSSVATATSYTIYRGTATGGEDTTPIVTGVHTTSFTNTGLADGTTYYFQVVAVNEAGPGSPSARSNEVNATPIATNGIVADNSFETPIQVGDVNAYTYNPNGSPWIFSGTSGIQANNSAWNAVNAPDGVQTAFLQGSGQVLGSMSQPICFITPGSYTINFQAAQRSGLIQPICIRVDGTQVGGNISPTSTSFASYTTASFTINTTGYHTISFSATDNTSDMSSFIDLVTITKTSPSAPTGLTATPGNAQVSLAWAASTGATSYNLKRSVVSGGPYSTVANPSTTSYTNTGLINGTTYYYVVSAVNAGGEGANSSQVSAALDGPPTVATSASATPNPVNGSTASLTVLGADDGGEAPLTYTWVATTVPSGAAAPTFSVNGTNAAKNTVATFKKAGAYGFTVTIKEPNGFTATSSVNVTVNQTISFISITPSSATLAPGATQQFTASAKDLFGNIMVTQPTFTWSATGGTISSAGLYTAGTTNGTFQVTVTASGKTQHATVTIAGATPVLTTILVAPASATVATGATQQFTATGKDQNGAPMSPQPTFTWSVSGGGTISSTGLFSATTVGGPFTVTASSGGKSGTASVTVSGAVNSPPTVATPASANPNPVTSTTSALSVLGADDGGEAALVYTWAATTIPSGAASPTFSANGTNAAKNSTVTFKKAGNYVFTVTIKDASNQTVTSTVSVTVNQTISFVSVTPTPVTVAHGATQQFTASAKDLFGITMTTQPTFTWTATGGTVTSGGLYTAGSTLGSFAVTAAASGKSGKATVTIN